MLCHFSPDSQTASRLLPRHAGAGGMTKVGIVAWVKCCYMGGRLDKELLA
jgi:hypothetical protein